MINDTYPYENIEIMQPLIDQLSKYVLPSQKIIWRGAFRWRDKDGFLNNHFESCDIKSLCDEFGYQLVHSFNHVAIVEQKK